MREWEQTCGDCVWFKVNPELAQMDGRNPYGLCEATFTSTRPHLLYPHFEGLAVLVERLVSETPSKVIDVLGLCAVFGADKFIPVETKFTACLSVGTFSSQSCHERDDRGSLLFTPKHAT